MRQFQPVIVKGFYGIFDTEEKTFVKMPSGKYCWAQIGHAKNAFINGGGSKIEEQDRYTIVEFVSNILEYK